MLKQLKKYNVIKKPLFSCFKIVHFTSYTTIISLLYFNDYPEDSKE